MSHARGTPRSFDSSPDAVADYFRTQADHLLRHIQDKNPAIVQAALARLRRARPEMATLADTAIVQAVRRGDALHTIAVEQHQPDWRSFVAQIGAPVRDSDHGIPDDGRAKRICIDFGNSNDGVVGGVMWVNATSAEEAIEIAQRAMPEMSGELDHFGGTGEVGYVQVYMNPNALSLAEIGDWEYLDEDDGATDRDGSAEPDSVVLIPAQAGTWGADVERAWEQAEAPASTDQTSASLMRRGELPLSGEEPLADQVIQGLPGTLWADRNDNPREEIEPDTSDDVILVAKLIYEGQSLVVPRNALDGILEEFGAAFDSDEERSYTVEIVRMTRAELEALPEFDGF